MSESTLSQQGKAISSQLLVLYFCVAIGGVGMGVVIPQIPNLLHTYEVSASLIGFSVAVMSIAGVIASIPAGKLADKIGAKLVLAFGLAIYGVSMLMFPLFHSVIAFFLLRAIEGVGWAAIWVGTEVLINLLSNPAQRIRNLSLYTVFTGIGVGIGPLLGAIGVEKYGIEFPFYLCAAITVIPFILIPVLLENHRGKRQEEMSNSTPQFMIQLIEPLLAAFLYGVVEAAITSFLIIYLQGQGLTMIDSGEILTVFVLGGVLLPLIVGILCKNANKYVLAKVGCLLLMLAAAYFPFIHNKIAIMLAGLLLGGSAGLLYIVGLAIVGDIVEPDKIGIGSALFSGFYGLGNIVGPIGGGLCYEFGGAAFVFYQIAILALIGEAVMIAFPYYKNKFLLLTQKNEI